MGFEFDAITEWDFGGPGNAGFHIPMWEDLKLFWLEDEEW